MESPRPSSPFAALTGRQRRERRRVFAAVAVLALLLHAILLGAANRAAIGFSPEPAIGATMAVRTVEAPAPLPDEPTAAPPAAPAAPPAAAPPLPPRPRPPPRAPRAPSVALAASSTAASARPDEPASGPAAEPASILAAAPAAEPSAPAASEPAAAAVSASGAEAASAPALVATEPAQAASAVARAASATFLAAGEQPPPTYRTLLPAPVTLRYEVRRGFFRGTGEIRWQPNGDRYELQLDARLAGITLLSQNSQGEIGAHGLAPTRFLDQRARRASQAANFRRDTGTITFSGPSTEWPLLAGTQDRLSWMIQLVGIVAADPERAADGARISMVLVGARGEASVRTLRSAGRDNAETASGSVPAIKFVVDGRSAYDSSYEIWLDPGRGWLPVHATARNGAGESEYDLLLERIVR
ncbi:MAG: DUF3108 domain-containing protein [Caldimonas sp.]